MVWLIALLVLAVALIAWFAGIYNGLVNLRNRFRNAFAQIDVQLKRRHDLIPNLVVGRPPTPATPRPCRGSQAPKQA